LSSAFDGGDELLLGRYRVVQRIASGGQGTVYLARSEGAAGFVRPVAVKRFRMHLDFADSDGLRMFAREAKILSGLRHPGIVAVLDFARDGEGYVMVLEYVHGYTLRHWLKFLRAADKDLPIEVACVIVTRVLDALHYAHEHRGADNQPLNIVHRDIAPDNVLIDVEGHVKLADFGIARVDTDVSHTSEDSVVVKGKFPYLAPELISGDAPGRMSDVYSAAVVLHEVLSGKNEFKDRDPRETMRRVLTKDLARLDHPDIGAPPELARVVERALEKDPVLRQAHYPTAAAFADAIREAMPGSERDAIARLGKSAARDFVNPVMVETANVKPLAMLEAAWRGTEPLASTMPPSDRPDRKTSGQPTENLVVDLREASGRPSPFLGVDRVSSMPPTRRARITDLTPKKLRLLSMILLVLASLGGAALVAYLVSSNQGDGPRPDAPVVFVHGDVDVEGADGSADATSDAGESVVVDVDAGSPDTGETHAQDTPASMTNGAPSPGAAEPDPQVLSRVFARRNARIARCFDTHAAGVAGVPQVDVDVDISTEGRVTAVQVHPASLEGTDLGRCIAQVARGTRFGPLSRSVAIRFPVTVSSR